MEGYESPVERQIREAQERGEFDNLPGAGKPLTNLGNADDPDWWVRGLIRREGLDLSGALPPALALRKEAAGFPASLVELSTEKAVREVLEDYNHRVRVDRLRPAEGKLPPQLAKTVDVDDMVERWRAMRAARTAAAPAPEVHAVHRSPDPPTPSPRRGWWARLVRWH